MNDFRVLSHENSQYVMRMQELLHQNLQLVRSGGNSVREAGSPAGSPLPGAKNNYLLSNSQINTHRSSNSGLNTMSAHKNNALNGKNTDLSSPYLNDLNGFDNS